MKWTSFPRTLLFAALAAAGVVPWVLLAGPLFGSARALAAYLVLAAASYLAGLAPDLRRRLGVFLAASAVGFGVVLVARTTPEVAIGLAVLVATARSGFLYRSAFSRAVVLEVTLVGAGLLFARFLSGPTLGGIMLAIWGFFLVQSLYFLVGGIRRREPAGRHPDPFEEACRRARALLEAP